MNNLYDFLFKYLEKEEIQIDKAEFSFQAQSHPEYPSLLSISDTLNFFNINNIAAKIDFSKVDHLPNRFIAPLYKETGEQNFSLVEKEGSHFLSISDKKSEIVSVAELEKRWTGVVMVIEKPDLSGVMEKKDNRWLNFLQYSSFILFVLFLIQARTLIEDKFFTVFPIAGILFSIAALKDLFGAKNELLNNFCNMTSTTSCESVVNSTRWKIFEVVNFSDLSIVFFSSQLVSLIVFLIAGNIYKFFAIQLLLLFMALPLIFLSIYFQKFIEKKWCPICLTISAIVVLELNYLLIVNGMSLIFSISSITYFAIIYVWVSLSWISLKNLFMQRKELKEFKIKGLRFMHNYEIFRKILFSSAKTSYYPLLSGNLLAGNKNANLRITVVLNIYCGHCVECHFAMIEILKKYKDRVCIDFRFNLNKNHATDESQSVHRKLMRIYYDQGEESFLEFLSIWFESKNEALLIDSQNSSISDERADEILNDQFMMNEENDIQLTPTILINNFQYPRMYDRKELIYFIEDLIEDEDLQ